MLFNYIGTSKTRLSCLIIILLHAITGYSQNNNKHYKHNYLSVFFTAGVSTQIHSYPNISNYSYSFISYNDEPARNWTSEKEYGKQGEAPIAIFGVGINKSYVLNSWLTFRPQLSYQQKGCSSGVISSSEVNLDGTRSDTEYKDNNRFHYTAGDALFLFNFSQKKVHWYLQSGLRAELLISYNIPYDIDHYAGNEDPNRRNSTDYRDFNRVNIGLITGIGVDFNKQCYLELNVNNDLGYLKNNKDFKVRNLIAFFSLGFTIKDRKSKYVCFLE